MSKRLFSRFKSIWNAVVYIVETFVPKSWFGTLIDKFDGLGSATDAVGELREAGRNAVEHLKRGEVTGRNMLKKWSQLEYQDSRNTGCV